MGRRRHILVIFTAPSPTAGIGARRAPDPRETMADQEPPEGPPVEKRPPARDSDDTSSPRETALRHRESAVAARERAIELRDRELDGTGIAERESAVAAREDAVLSREEAARLREEAVRAHEELSQAKAERERLMLEMREANEQIGRAHV